MRPSLPRQRQPRGASLFDLLKVDKRHYPSATALAYFGLGEIARAGGDTELARGRYREAVKEGGSLLVGHYGRLGLGLVTPSDEAAAILTPVLEDPRTQQHVPLAFYATLIGGLEDPASEACQKLRVITSDFAYRLEDTLEATAIAWRADGRGDPSDLVLSLP